MSWAADNWTTGLSGQVLKKVQELQVNNEKLIRERQQRQLQLDNSEAALHKQKQKYEEARAELGVVQREMVGVREQAQAEARARDRLTQDLQAKVAQVCTLEGQLDSTRTLVQNLTQEVKRLEAELEKLQKETGPGESMLFSTPCWNMNSPWEQSGKSSLRGEDVNKVQQKLLFGDSTKLSASASSSPFPQQPHRTSPPLRRKASQSEARPPSSVFPWERDDTRSTPRGKAASAHGSSSFTCTEVIPDTSARDDGIEEALRKEIDGLRARVSGLSQELQLEKERCRESESRLAQIQKELNLNEQNLTRSRDELARAHTRITQEGDRAQGAEQRVKQLQDELKCQRQNAETSRCNAEQRRKEIEREHQRELLELQRERQSMEKQHQQETNKLNQEIQQARTQHNTLQSQYDKLALQKQVVEKDLEEVQRKLKNTQSDLTESQKRETHMQAKLSESLKENEGLSVLVEQLKKREKSLEAEVKRLTEELADALKLIKELQAQLAAPPPQVVSRPVAGDSFSPVLSTSYSPPHQPSSQRKKTLKSEKPKISDRPGLTTYPSEREPGEGIDSEHISEFGSEDSPTVSIQEGNRYGPQRSSEAEIESSITEQDTGIEDIDTDSCMSDSISERIFKDDIRCDTEKQKSISSKQKQDSPSIVELKKENSSLRSELKDIKRELDQRLDDLESQRRAEAEARTKLKQLSKKHSSQAEQHRTKAQELKEKGSKLEAQLEQERKESVRLREVITILEKEAEKRIEEGEREGEEAKEENMNLKEALAQMERKEEDLEKEREKMRKELEVLQSELLQEREEREREREEEKKLRKTYEGEEIKIAKLQAELERLQSSAPVEGKNVKTNMPLTYLQLGDNPNLINDGTALENDVMSSFSDNIFSCESTNLQNAMFSKEPKTALITECGSGLIPGEHSPVEQESTLPGNLEDHTKTTEGKNLDDTTVLILEVERMRVQRDREAEKSKKLQKKLEALQNQVTSQTQQLTLAFENQSKHIEGLLRELQQRDSALQRQGEELQMCQEELASLKVDKQMTEMVSSMTPSAEKSSEVSAEPSGDLAISTTSQNSHEVATHESFPIGNSKPLQSDQQSFMNVEVGKNQNGNVSAASDKTSMSHVILDTAEYVTSASPDVYGKDFVHDTKNTDADEVPELLNAAQQDSDHAVETNIQSSVESSFTETKELPEYLQKLLGHSTDNTSPLKVVINRLHEAQNELSELKARHDQLTLQLQEVSRQDVLSLKQEHEQLKLKLKLIDSEPCSSETYITQDDSNHVTNTTEDSVAVTDLEVVIGGSLEDRGPKCGTEQEQSENESCASAHVYNLHQQLQALQSELQLLSAKNRDQAEELQLWRLSALTPEDTLDQKSNSNPIVVEREEQLVLSCSPTALHSHTKQNSTMVQYGGLYQPMGFSEPCNADHQIDYQTSLDKSTEDLASIKAKELIADENSAINVINDHLKPKIRSMNYKSAFQDLSSEMENCDHRHDLAHQMKQMGTSKDQQPGNQPCEITFSLESREDVLSTKVIDPDGQTESAERKDYYASSVMHDDLVTSTHGGKAQGNTTLQESRPSPSPVSNTSNYVLREDNVLEQQEFAEVTGSIDKAGAKKVNSVCTQTEECNREIVMEFEGPPQRPIVLHASTQTSGEETTQPEEVEEQNEECTESPPLSPSPPSHTEKLLLSGSFPIPANPAHLAERIRRNRSRMSAAYDDTEYEPYGLPEVVMKGFADIPSGPACPYVLRRGLLGTDALPITIKESPLTEADEEIDP